MTRVRYALLQLVNAAIYCIWAFVAAAAVLATFTCAPFVLLQKFLTKGFEEGGR